MKLILPVVLLLLAHNLLAQKDTLPSAVYSWNKAKVQTVGKIERRQIANGSTLDLDLLEIRTTTLLPGEMNHPPKANLESEELLIVKEGNIKTTIEDSSKMLGPGGLLLLMPGDKQSFINESDKPVTYYVFIFKSKDGLHAERGKSGGGTFCKDWNDFTVRQTDKGQSRPIFDRPSSMFKRFDVHATTLNPGQASHLPHTHRAEEIILMIKGTGEMQIGEKFYPTTVGDVVLLNSMIPHAIKNNGKVPCSYFAIQWHSNAE
jgi:(S)-ureidoglycine aminohydrolase